MESLHLIITDNYYYYGLYVLSNFTINSINLPIKNYHRRKLKLDCAYTHYLLKELCICDTYRKQFLYYQMFRKTNTNNICDCIIIVLQPTKYNLIDYNWNERVYDMARERCELDHTLSWLSTLGGAFSALGDYFENCAEIAGKISVQQLKLAFKLNDPTVQSRCRLYFSLSLIQRKHFKLAKDIITDEYKKGKKSVVIDTRLINMCKGIWSKLQYEYKLYTQVRKKR